MGDAESAFDGFTDAHTESKRKHLLKTKGIKFAPNGRSGKEAKLGKAEGQAKVPRGKKMTEKRRVK